MIIIIGIVIAIGVIAFLMNGLEFAGNGILYILKYLLISAIIFCIAYCVRYGL